MTSADSRRPRLWLLLGERAGDNAQVLVLGRLLGECYGWIGESRRLRYRPFSFLAAFRGARNVVDWEASDLLAPPWPDIVIAIGRRAAPVARWIAREARRTQGVRSLLIHLGRPRLALARFDLILTTPQYDLPAAGNVMPLTLPLAWHDKKQFGEASDAWRARFAALPRPWTAVLVGGPSPHLAFGAQQGRDLAAMLAAWQSRHGGSLLVTTSPRTDEGAAAALAAGLGARSLFLPFAPGGENPYKALLALADFFIVTGDSASMTAEAVLTGKPVAVFELPAIDAPRRAGLAGRIQLAWERRRRRRRLLPPTWLDRLFILATRLGLMRPSRAIELLHRRLYALGWATPLSSGADPAAATDAGKAIAAEREAAVRRIGELWRAHSQLERRQGA